MRAKRIKLSNAIHAEFDFLEDKCMLIVPYNVDIVIYKFIGSHGGMEVWFPISLYVGLDKGSTNWTNYHFMEEWVQKMNLEAIVYHHRSRGCDTVEPFILLARPKGSTHELEEFFKDNGGTATLEEIRQFESQKNISKWENAPDPDPGIVYIGKKK